MQMKRIPFIFSFLFLAFSLAANNVTITGKLLDKETLQAVAGAIVSLEATNSSVVTDEGGVFELVDIAAGDYQLLSSTELLLAIINCSPAQNFCW